MQESLEGTAAGSRKATGGQWHDPDSFHYEVFRIILQNEILATKSHWAGSRSLRERGRWEGCFRRKHNGDKKASKTNVGHFPILPRVK